MHHREMRASRDAADDQVGRGHFARLAAHYDRLRPLDHNWEEMLSRLVEEAELHGRSVLEVGAGTRRLAEALAGRYGCSVAPDGIAAISTPDPESFGGFVWATYFPSYSDIDRARFPSAQALLDELEEAGFDSTRVVRLQQQKSMRREEALAKMRERAFSTFDLIGEAEFEAGLRRAEETLPAEVSYPQPWLIALGVRGADDAS